MAWSRILDDEEVLCPFNSHGRKARSADVLVDAVLNRIDGKGRRTVVFNSAQEAARPRKYSGTYRKGSKQTVKGRHGMAYVEIGNLAASRAGAGIASGEGGGGGSIERSEGWISGRSFG